MRFVSACPIYRCCAMVFYRVSARCLARADKFTYVAMFSIAPLRLLSPHVVVYVSPHILIKYIVICHATAAAAVPEGYQFMHDGRLLTIFSASRYCGRGTNRGAFIVFEADLTHTVQQFVAGDLESSAPARKPPPADTAAVLQQFELATPIAAGRLAELKRVGPGGLTPALGAESDDADEAAQAEAVRRMIVERICLHKADLFAHWAAVEKRSTGPRNGHISRMQWAEGMRVVLNLELPWISLADMLVDREPDGRINFSLFLDRYRIAMRDCDTAWMDGILERVCSRLFVACESLEDAFKAMDADGSGVVGGCRVRMSVHVCMINCFGSHMAASWMGVCASCIQAHATAGIRMHGFATTPNILHSCRGFFNTLHCGPTARSLARSLARSQSMTSWSEV